MPRQPDVKAIESILGHQFDDQALLARSLTHSSLRTPDTPCNERLEFLGDSILGMIISEHLYTRLPEHPEGELTRIKSVVVSRSCIGHKCCQMGIEPHIRLGKGIAGKGVLPTSVFANVFEALIAALYLDAGIECARRFVIDQLGPIVEEIIEEGIHGNHKSALQDLCQKRFQVIPQYVLLGEEGPDHYKTFELCVEIDGRQFPSASGQRKKEAEQYAAREALRILQTEDSDGQTT